MTIETLTVMPIEFLGEYCWYMTDGSFIDSDDDAALIAALAGDDVELGEAPDNGDRVCDLYKITTGESTTVEVRYGPRCVCQVQHDAIAAAGITA